MRNIWERDLGEELFLSYAEILNQALAPLDDILTDAKSVWFRATPRKEVLATSLREAPGRADRNSKAPTPPLGPGAASTPSRWAHGSWETTSGWLPSSPSAPYPDRR